MKFLLHRHKSILDIDKTKWNCLARNSPFLSHQFLSALENNGCVGDSTAWKPIHISLTDQNGELLGALPLYLKHDSRGEFVFDWNWADAYEHAGLPYYPKLVSAVPFTPATGQRLLVKANHDFPSIARALLAEAKDIAKSIGASSLHILFPTEKERNFLAKEHLIQRKNCQFHWHNQGYKNFDDFMDSFTSKKRKKVHRERRRVSEAGIQFEFMRGDQPSKEEWDIIYNYYANTFTKRGSLPYLNRKFFNEISKTMPDKLLVIVARFDKKPIATAICFRTNNVLYGRYWGSLADFHSLHFETCYYQGIEYCISEGLDRFEPGTQGEHKLSRGFTPMPTWSHHWIREPVFEQALTKFVIKEDMHIEAYMKELSKHTPYRQTQTHKKPIKKVS